MPSGSSPSPRNRGRSVLFVCAGNTCRSVMAEALARARFGDAVRVSSAGLRPQPPEDAQNAINTLKFEFGIDASRHVPRDVKAVDLTKFDTIVAMDKYVAKQLKALTPREIVIWNIDDPWGSNGYKPCALSILRQLRHLGL